MDQGYDANLENVLFRVVNLPKGLFNHTSDLPCCLRTFVLAKASVFAASVVKACAAIAKVCL